MTPILECCQDPANRETTQAAEHVTAQRCTVCGRRHIELVADPGRLGLKPTP